VELGDEYGVVLHVAVVLGLVVNEFVIVADVDVNYIVVDLLMWTMLHEAMEILSMDDEDRVLRNDFAVNNLYVVQQVEGVLLVVDYYVVV
jgi:hypothetical protein